MSLSVAKADDFEDDGGIAFSQYDHVVILTSYWAGNEVENRDKWMVSIVEMLGWYLSQKGYTGIATREMQALLFQFP